MFFVIGQKVVKWHLVYTWIIFIDIKCILGVYEITLKHNDRLFSAVICCERILTSEGLELLM